MMQTNERIKLFASCVAFLALASGAIAHASAEFRNSARIDPPQGVRDRLTFDDLMGGNYPELVHNEYFMPIGSDTPAVHPLSGVISFAETTMDTNHPTSTWAGGGMRYFPGGITP